MSRFNVRPITPAAPPMVPLIPNRKPSAYTAMKLGATAPALNTISEDVPKKGVRQTKEEMRKHKMSLATAKVAMLVESKPTKAKIRDFMESRMLELDAEKM